MDSFYRKPLFFAAVLFLSLSVGCEESEDEVVQIPDSPPQITITLRSDLTIVQPLDPDPQYEKSAALKPEQEKKKKVKFGRRAPPLPAFKADEGYQSLNRFENSVPETFKIEFEKKPEIKDKRVRETVKLQDKPLVFGARGFNIEVFGHERMPAVEVDYSSHLREPPPLLKQIGAADHLDPNAEYSKDTKDLIYGETRVAFGKMPPPLVEPEPIKPATESKKPIEKHPDSVLVFPPGEDSIAVVSRDEESLDLLAGNENLNKKRFRSE
ncbi:MAG: hypothetical protein F3742_01960 [Nitrospinae bacterium]|nr:hypothetical protein [Nitrospinota bacterium]